MNKVEVKRISDVPGTMLIPLWARAVESQRARPIVRDTKAVEIMERIDYDFSKFRKAALSQVGVSIGTMLLDRATLDFLERRPQAVVVNLGAGLDTRFERIADGRIRTWYDLDLPEAIELRRRFFSAGAHNVFLAKSLFDFSWMDDVADDGAPVLIIAEGLLMYFTEHELRPLFHCLAQRFPRAEMLFEMLSPMLVGKARYHDSVTKVGGAVEFRWGLLDSRVLESWDHRLQFVAEWNYFDFHRERWGYLRWPALVPAFRRYFNNRIVHLRFD
jgi:O-methyltransferase involved in polyketide biosynthesis